MKNLMLGLGEPAQNGRGEARRPNFASSFSVWPRGVHALCAFAAAALPLLAQTSVQYQLKFPNAVHHEAEIRATFQGVSQPVLEVLMSRSSPGRYALHEFAKNVYNLRASDGAGHALPVMRPNPYGWNVSGHHGTVVIDYTLYGDRVDGTYAAIDQTHAHLNLPATLVWARGFEHAPASLRFEVPAGSNWHVATQLIPEADGAWSAPNLEWMMDSPVELSNFDMPEWKIENATFRLALHHQGTPEAARSFAELCKAVVLEEEGVFGAFPKYDGGTYTFLIDYLPYADGDGMEHRDSTVISGTEELPASARSAIGTVSHEFFHSWNVKRIRPRGLEPFDFERANMSGALWFAEGFTNYYGPLTLARAGISTPEQFFSGMGHAVNGVLRAPGRNINDVVEMSRMAPFVDAARSIDPTNFENIFISYYTYGQALAFGIDLAIREQFPGKSLDDWMREVWREHADIDRPYALDDLQSALAKATGSRQFAADLFERHISGKEPLDYAALLAPAGLKLQKTNAGNAWLGRERLSSGDGAVEIAGNTLMGSPLYNAGLEHGDQITACSGQTIANATDLRACAETHSPGEKIKLSVKTRAGTKIVQVTLAEDPSLEIVMNEHTGLPLTTEQKTFRELWLQSKALHHLPKFE
jgi:predicted metalloprotease with PDZ domain